MPSEATPVVVTILGKEYRIACPDDEKESLTASARYLDEKMREIRDRGRAGGSGGDNVAIMAALNITHELLQDDNPDKKLGSNLTNRIKTLQNKIEAALSNTRQIEI